MQILIALAGLGLKLLSFFSKSKAEQLGRALAHREQEKATRAAEERMGRVGPSSKQGTVDKLRKNGF